MPHMAEMELPDDTPRLLPVPGRTGDVIPLEDVLRESGLDWVILRPGGFASNALWWAESVRARRIVAAPFGDTGVPVIDSARTRSPSVTFTFTMSLSL